MNKYLSNIGYQGPNTLFTLIILSLAFLKNISKPNLYIAVLIWQFASHLLNVVIKNILKFPRPASYDNKDEFDKITITAITWKNYLTIHRNFGMPSGHAQAVVSELTFIALYFENPVLTTVAALQTALTLYQRYVKRRHSIKQLAAGSALGFVVGAGFYTAVKKYNI